MPLSDLLVLCPTFAGLSPETELVCETYRKAGAKVVRSNGCPDLPLHRCLIARLAERVLQGSQKFRRVLWLDGDMAAGIGHVQRLTDCLSEITAKLDRDRSTAPALSARYVRRADPRLLAAKRLPVANPAKMDVEVDGVLYRACYAGMGFLLQTLEAFRMHLEEAERVGWHVAGHFPAICSSMPVREGPNNLLVWSSEDWTYSAWEWKAGRGVYLAPVDVGHVASHVAWPGRDLDLTEADGHSVPAKDTEQAPVG